MKRIGRPKTPLELSPRERRELESLKGQGVARPRLAQRAEIILACATGAANSKVAEDLQISSATVGKWRRRFLERRLAGLEDAPRSGAPKRIADEDIERVVRLTLESSPGSAWSTRSLARVTGLSQTAISRTWRAFSVKPASTPKESPAESSFPEFVRDIVGIYVSPGEKALVLLASRPPAAGTTVVGRPPSASETVSNPSLRALVDAARSAEEDRKRQAWWGPLLRLLSEIDRRLDRRVIVHVLLARRRDRQGALVHRWATQRTRFRVHFAGGEDLWLEMTEQALAACRELQGKDRTECESALEKRVEQWPYRWTPFEVGD